MANIGQPPGGGFGAPPQGGQPGGMPPGGMGGQPPMGGAPMGGAPMGGAPMGGAPAGDAPNFMLWMIIGIAGVFLCWGGGLFNLIGAILAFVGKSAWEKGDTEGGQKKLKIAKILVIIGIVFGVLAYIGGIVANILVAGAASAGSY